MNDSPEAREAQAELAAEAEHVTVMRQATEAHAWAVAAEGMARESLVKAQAGVLNAVTLAIVLASGLGAWYVVAVVL